MFRRVQVFMHLSFLVVVVVAAGCSDNKTNIEIRESSDSPQINSPKVPSKTDALDELKKIAHRGKEDAVSDDDKLEDVHVDVKKTSSLVYPYVGRIISTWKTKSSRGLRYWIYYKFDGIKWTPTWATPGGIGTIGSLTENEAMREPADERMKYPWSSTNPKLWTP